MRRLFILLAVMLMVGVVGATINDYNASLVLLMHMNQTAGSPTTFVESSTGKTVTVVGGSTTNTTDYRFGNASGFFDGNGDHLTLADNAAWYFGSSNFTMCALYKRNTASKTILSSQVSTGYKGHQFWIDANGATFNGYNNGAAVAVTKTVAGDNNWHQACVIGTLGTVTVYVDGSGGIPVSAPVADSTQTLNIGMDWDLTSNEMNGNIDEFAIWKSTTPGAVPQISTLYPQQNEVNSANITPTSFFTGTPRLTKNSTEVSFTDNSANVPVSWGWNFGDGNFTGNTSQNPTHLYAATGSYTVSLNATNSAGSGTTTKLAYINITNTTGYDWSNLTTTDLPGRSGAGAVSFNGYMWVFGGRSTFTSSSPHNTTYRSTDGITWMQVNDANWTKRAFFGHCIFNNKIWVAGGYDDTGNNKNDVWSAVYNSTHGGLDWTQENASAGFGVRHANGLLSYDGAMWVIGGYPSFHDVWRSTDGKVWTSKTTTAGFPVQTWGSAVVFNNKMWVINGKTDDTYNPTNYPPTVYSSTDGITWTLIKTGTWGGRYVSPIGVSPDGIFMLGGGYWEGGSAPTIELGDVWLTQDGTNWYNITNLSTGSRTPTFMEPVVYHNSEFYLPGGIVGNQTISPAVWKSVYEESIISPTASFDCTPTSAIIGGSIACMDTSTGAPTNWTYYWGDGNVTDGTQNPSYTYPFTGTFSINQTVNNSAGFSWYNRSNYITITNVSGFTQQDLWQTGHYTKTLHITDSSTNAPIPVVVVTDSNGQSYTTTNGTAYFTEDAGAVVFYFAATGYVSKSMSYIIDGDSTDTVQMVATGEAPVYNVYPPKDVKFHITSFFGTPITDATVTIQGITTSTGNWDWLVTLLGISLDEVAINGTAMSETTDSNGDAVFLMLPSVKYNITTTAPGYTFPTSFIAPQATEYTITANWNESWFSSGNDTLKDVNVSVSWVKYNDTYSFVNITYDDQTMTTTGGTITVYRDSTARVANASAISTMDITAPSCSNSTLVNTPTGGVSYRVLVNATTTDENIMRTFTHYFKGAPVTLPGWTSETLLWLALFIVIFTAAFAGAIHSPQMAIVLCVESWVFWAIGWLDALITQFWYGETAIIGVLVLASFLAVMWNITEGKSKVKRSS